MGVVRTTYLIDENGIIEKAFDKVKAADNPDPPTTPTSVHTPSLIWRMNL